MGTRVKFLTEAGDSQGPTTGTRACHNDACPATRKTTLIHTWHGSERKLWPNGFAGLRGIILSLGLLFSLICLTRVPAPAQSSNQGNQGNNSRARSSVLDTSRNEIPEPMTPEQKRSIMRANFEKSKSDAVELAALAKGLREVLDRPNANLLSLEVINRAEKIEKLARKIREETKGF